MNLTTFINDYDKAETIILLAGKRNVPASDVQKLLDLGKLLASNSKHMRFRSGNADGADKYFMDGVAAVDNSRLEVVVPYTGHKKKNNVASTTYSLDNIDLVNEPDVTYQSKYHKETKHLVDDCANGKKYNAIHLVKPIIRSTVMVIGAKDISPSNFGIFYNDLKDPFSGGTGHTINICNKNNIPVIDQRVWFNW